MPVLVVVLSALLVLSSGQQSADRTTDRDTDRLNVMQCKISDKFKESSAAATKALYKVSECSGEMSS